MSANAKIISDKQKVRCDEEKKRKTNPRGKQTGVQLQSIECESICDEMGRRSTILDEPKKGSIKSISLKNFMTYHEATFNPGQKFNVIIGPNGSGKSSIVTAITIGLGGDISLLRRQKHLSELVSNEIEDGDHAEVRIEIYRGEKDKRDGSFRSHSVLCKITKEGQASYFIDGRRVAREEVCRLAERHQIQTSNLCQFLPQDVVREFPEMTPDKVFHSTLRAIGDTDMLNKHDGLKKKQESRTTAMHILETKKNTFRQTESNYNSKKKLREEVKRRQELESTLKLMEIQEKYLKFLDHIKKTQHAQKEVASKDDIKSKLEKTRSELKKRVAEFDKRRDLLRKENNELNKKIAAAQATMKHPEVSKVESAIEQLTSQINAYDEDLLNAKEQMEKKQKFLEKNRNDLINLKVESLEEKRHGFEYKKNQFKVDHTVCENQIKDLEEKVGIVNGKIQAKKEKEKELTSEDNKKLSVLKHHNDDAYRGVEWLRNNRDKFRKPVHEPMMMLLRLKPECSQYAIHLENIVGKADMEAFVCEDRDDANLLSNTLRKQVGLHKINVVNSEPPSANDRFRFEHPDLRGITEHRVFLDEVIRDDCPPAVRKHLCQKQRIHMIPVFNAMPRGQLPGQVMNYFVNDKKIKVKKSIYTNQLSKSTDSMAGERPRFLGTSFVEEDESIAKIKEEIQGLINQKKAHVSSIEKVNREDQEIAERIKEVDRKIDDIQKQLTQAQNINRNIVALEAEIEQLRSGKNLKELKAKAVSDRIELTKKLLAANRRMLDVVGESSNNAVKVELNEILINQINTLSLDDRNRLSVQNAEFDNLQAELKELKAILAQQRNNMKVLLKELPWDTNNKVGNPVLSTSKTKIE